MKRTLSTLALILTLAGCFSDPLIDGTDPYAPTVFKEGSTPLPLNPPNKKYLVPLSVSQTTVFKFAIDTESIKIGNDGVTRYIVVITTPVVDKTPTSKEFGVKLFNGVFTVH